MKVYQLMQFYANGWNEGHNKLTLHSTKEKAEAAFKKLGLSHTYKPNGDIDPLWGDYIMEIEVD